MAALTEEQTLIRDQAKAWATSEAPVTAFRKMRDSGVDVAFEAPTWKSMIDMGWTGILVPEAHGGSDLGHLTFGVVLEELARQLVAAPLFASAFAGASALRVAGSEAQQAEYLPKIVDGSAVFTLAIDEGPRFAPTGVALTASAADGGFVLSGSKSFVMEGLAATHFVVSARTAGNPGDAEGISLFVVPADAAGITRSRMHTHDSRGFATVAFDSVRIDAGAALGDVGGAATALETILDRCAAGIGAEMIGTAGQSFEMTLDYLKTREQFGRIIGSFQALGHRAAELFSRLEKARSCAEAALTAIDAGADDAAELVSLSKCFVGDSLHWMSNQLIQIHGGIGMTDEFDAGFYLKRARVLETLFGNQSYHRDRYARLRGF